MAFSKNIWITGASSGIGEALAMQWAVPGATIILSGLEKVQLEPVADTNSNLTVPSLAFSCFFAT